LAAILGHVKFSNSSLMRRLLILVFVTILFQAVFGQKEKLGFNLAVGQMYYQTIQSSTSSELQNVNGPKFKIGFVVSVKIAFTIIGLKDSIYDITASFVQLSSVTKLPFGGGISFNSDKKDEHDTLSNVLRAVIDKPFLIKMTTHGKIVEIKNIDSIIKQALDKFPELSLAQKIQFKGQFTQSFGEDVLRENLEMVTAIYPNNPVEKGDTWTLRRDFASKVKETFVSTYQLKDKFENYNLIVGNGNIEIPNEDGYTQINGMLMKSNSTDAINKSLQVDSKTGWIIKGKINESMSGKTEVKDDPNLPAGVKQTMTTSIEITYSSQ
jgi:hypothetical protein